MANKRARDRQLAKLAARRQAERHARQQRRARVVGGLIGLLVVGLAVAGVVILTDDDGSQAQPSVTPPASSAGPSPKPTVTGTVSNEAQIPTDVACDADAPRDAAADKPQYSNVPPLEIDPSKVYTATISTSCGDIVAEMDPASVPIAVNSFVFLARKGFYDGLWFHRIAPGFVIQGGDPLGTGFGGPGYTFTTETNPELTFTQNGYVLAFGNTGPDSNGSQFFVTVGEQKDLDPPNGPYTAFARVVEGEQVVDTINGLPTTDSEGDEKSRPLEAVYIESVTIDEEKQR